MKMTSQSSSVERSVHNNNVHGKSTDDRSSPSKAGTQKEKMLYVVFVSLLIDLLAFTMILPLLPSLLDYYGSQGKDNLYQHISSSVHWFRELVGAPNTARWNSVLFGGLIGSLFSFLQFLASPLLGAASDVYGRRPVLLLSSIGVAASYVLWALSQNFTIFVIARIVGGISKGNVSLSTAVVADILPPSRRGKGMALVGVAFSVGFLIGPLIGAYFAVASKAQGGGFYTTPAICAFILSLLNIIFLVIFFKETLPQEKHVSSVRHGLHHSSHLINPSSLFGFTAVQNVSNQDMKNMQQLGLIYFMYLFLFSGLEFTLTFLTHYRFQYDSMQQGKMFFFMGIIMASVQGGYVRRLKQGTEKKMGALGMQLLIPSFLVIGFAKNTVLFYIGLALFSFASATVVPCLTTLISTYGTADQKGTVMGIFRSLGALARAVGPICASTVYWSAGALPCYIVGGVGIFIPLLLLMKLKTEKSS